MPGPGGLFLATLPIIVSLYASKYRTYNENISFPKNPKNLNLPQAKTFDFIVVGGGTAGGVLASLLSKNNSVLLVEAGGKPPPIYAVPRALVYISEHKATNFLYPSTKQKKSGLGTGGIIEASAGKMLGGSSTHNDMIWERGNPLDYDRWASVSGDASWKYKNVLKYFRQLENYHGSFKLTDQHGQGGPVDIAEDSFPPGRDLWLQAGLDLGYKIRDPNGPQSIGFAPIAFSKKKGRRVSSYTAYIKPALKRKGSRLTISKYSTVNRVIFKGKTAVGVEFKKHGVPRVAYASKEVILSTGVFATPIILIQSGIGPKDQVDLAQVEQIAELPVGKNLIDHPKIDFGPIRINDPSLSWDIETNLTYDDINNYRKNGKGPLATSSQSFEAHIFSPTREAYERSIGQKKKWPDLQVTYSPIGFEPSTVVCIIGNTRPSSVGQLTLNATNGQPIIDFNYYDEEIDVDVTIDGINFCLKIMEETRPFQNIGARVEQNDLLAKCGDFKFRSKDYWKCFTKYNTRTGYHSVGTCRMGRDHGDPKAVVDSKLRVIGVDRLRVVDASIFPFISNANTAAPCWMLGVKMADEILQFYNKIKNAPKSSSSESSESNSWSNEN